MKKFKVNVRVVEVRNREYTIYASSRDDIEDIISATNFDFTDYDDEEFVDNSVEEVLNVEEETDR